VYRLLSASVQSVQHVAIRRRWRKLKRGAQWKRIRGVVDSATEPFRALARVGNTPTRASSLQVVLGRERRCLISLPTVSQGLTSDGLPVSRRLTCQSRRLTLTNRCCKDLPATTVSHSVQVIRSRPPFSS